MSDGILKVHQAFVVYTTGEETRSCGMHNMGLRDAVVRAEDSDDPVELLRVFTQYQYIEEPDTRSGHTFSVDKDAPRYRLSEEMEPVYALGSLFNNPFGFWRLRPI